MPFEERSQVVIVGGGPAGLTAALELCENGEKCLVVEKDGKYLDGLSRTVEHKGHRFDIGGHLFFSKSKEIEDWWSHILSPSEFAEVKRKSRIYYRAVPARGSTESRETVIFNADSERYMGLNYTAAMIWQGFEV